MMTKFELTLTMIFVVSVALAATLPLPYSLTGFFGVGVVIGALK
jgi:hypothetical protein